MWPQVTSKWKGEGKTGRLVANSLSFSLPISLNLLIYLFDMWIGVIPLNRASGVELSHPTLNLLCIHFLMTDISHYLRGIQGKACYLFEECFFLTFSCILLRLTCSYLKSVTVANDCAQGESFPWTCSRHAYRGHGIPWLCWAFSFFSSWPCSFSRCIL